MSTEQDQVRLMAERIARRVSQKKELDEADARHLKSKGEVGDELAAMRESLEELKQRLVQIESHVTNRSDDASQSESRARGDEQGNSSRAAYSSATSHNGVRSPWLSGVYVSAAHPSQERFGVEEATVSELVDFFEKEKKCEIEPGGKPCDHCSMCSTRGF